MGGKREHIDSPHERVAQDSLNKGVDVPLHAVCRRVIAEAKGIGILASTAMVRIDFVESGPFSWCERRAPLSFTVVTMGVTRS